MKSGKILSIALAVCLVAGAAFAQGPHGGKGGGMPGAGPGLRMLDKIPDLTEKQQEQIRKIRKEVRVKMRTIGPDMIKLHAELQGLLEDGAAKAKVDAQIDEVAKKKAAAMKVHADALRKTAKILNEKQKDFLWSHSHGLGGGCSGKGGHGAQGAACKHGGGKPGPKRGAGK